MFARIGYFAAAVGTVALGGCDLSLEQFLYSGTTRAFAACLEQAKKQNVLSESAAKTICSDKHSTSIKDILEGKAGYRRTYGTIKFGGEVKNSSPDQVVTSFSVVLNRKDKPEGEFRTFAGLWIEPGKSYSFDIIDLEYTNDESLDINKGTFDWTTAMTKGLKVSF